MPMHTFRIFLLSALSGSLILACTQKETEQEELQQVRFTGPVVPPHFPEMHYTFAGNPVTAAGVELGRMLFYDPRLSADGTISCASCHAQVHAFADHGTVVSTGIHGRVGIRNSPPMQNLAWSPAFMWDGGINHIEVMPIAPITDPNEMGETMFHLEQKLQDIPEYHSRFQSAFGSDSITSEHLLKALAQFMSMMISADSKYDRVMLGRESFSPIEQEGYELFQTYCNSCHTEPLMTDFRFRNNGIGGNDDNDEGRYRITLDDADKGKFKTPSLRNISITAPYMHDGRIANLRTVIERYSEGVPDHPNRDPLLSQPFSFTPEQIDALHYFLYTLEDHSFLSNPILSEP